MTRVIQNQDRSEKVGSAFSGNDAWLAEVVRTAFPGTDPNTTREMVEAEILRVVAAVLEGDFEDITDEDD